jgi:hypothetical protein
MNKQLDCWEYEYEKEGWIENRTRLDFDEARYYSCSTETSAMNQVRYSHVAKKMEIRRLFPHHRYFSKQALCDTLYEMGSEEDVELAQRLAGTYNFLYNF